MPTIPGQEAGEGKESDKPSRPNDQGNVKKEGDTGGDGNLTPTSSTGQKSVVADGNQANNSITDSLQLLDSLKKIHRKHFQCPLCLDPLKDPCIIPTCLHRFCSECLRVRWNSNFVGNPCPTCKVAVLTDSVRVDSQYKVLEKDLSDLIITQLGKLKEGDRAAAAATFSSNLPLQTQAQAQAIAQSQAHVTCNFMLNGVGGGGQGLGPVQGPTQRKQPQSFSGLKRKQDGALTPFEKFLKKKNVSGATAIQPNEKDASPDDKGEQRKVEASNETNQKDSGITSSPGKGANTNDEGAVDPKTKEGTAAVEQTKEGSEEMPIEITVLSEIQPRHGGLILTPGSNDVLNGRGGRINSHRGNVQFRQLVNRYKHTYLASKKLDKVKIANKIVQYVRSMNPTGRFLMEDSASGYWVEIGDDKARKKAGQAMREKSDETRKEIKQRRGTSLHIGQHQSQANTQNLSTLASVALFDFATTRRTNTSARPHP